MTLKNRYIKMVRRVANANFLVTSCQLVGHVGRVEFGERHRQTNQQQTAGLPNLPIAGSMS